MEMQIFSRGKERNIYSGLYDIYRENIVSAGKSTTLGKSLFISELYSDITCVDLGLLIGVPTEEFVMTAYVNILGRMSEPETIKKWNEIRADMDEDEFKCAVVRSLILSDEFLDKGIVVKNNIFEMKEKIPTTKKIVVDFEELSSYDDLKFVEEVYKCLLNRDCDDAGREINLRALDSGTSTREDVICSMMYSKECDVDNVELINFKPKRLHSKTFMALDDEQFVKAIYQWILIRKTDVDGYMSHIDALKSKSLLKAEMLKQIAESEEATRNGVIIIDKDSLLGRKCRLKRLLMRVGLWKIYSSHYRKKAMYDMVASIVKENLLCNEKIEELEKKIEIAEIEKLCLISKINSWSE